MTIDELQRLMAELPPRWRLFFEFLAHTGLRIGEASELRWGRDLVLGGPPYVKLRWQFADGRVVRAQDAATASGTSRCRPGWSAKLRAAKPPTPTVSSSSLARGTRLDRHNCCPRSWRRLRGAPACRG